jgi:hypothetical protein
MARILPGIAACFVLLVVAAPAHGQEPLSDAMQTEVAELKVRIDLFFKQLAGPTPDAERAVRDLILDGPLQDRTDEIARLIDQAQPASLEARYGQYTGHEAVSVRPVGSDLVFLRYLYKGKRFPAVWHFAFYRTAGAGGFKTDWSLISLRFDSKIESLDR